MGKEWAKKRLWRVLLALLLGGSTTVLAVARAGTVTWNAVFWGIATLLLIWLAVRPQRAVQRPLILLRTGVYGAVVFSALAAAVVLGAIFGPSERSRGLAVVAAVIAVPFAVWLWWTVYSGWKRGWRWSGPSFTPDHHDDATDEPA
jgi:hypothetical protein